MKRRKGFTLVELLVVIAIIALLMGILMPALAEVRRMAYRVLCGTNLRGLGNAFSVYANDNDGDLPRSGGKGSRLAGLGDIGNRFAVKPADVAANTSVEEYVFNKTPPRATITSSLYYLVKYASTSPKQFVCKGDAGAEVFDLGWYDDAEVAEVALAWDFGYKDNDDITPMPGECNSYAYHFPFAHTGWGGSFRSFELTQGMNPSSAVAADRNPYADKNAQGYIEGIDDDDREAKWNGDNRSGTLEDDDLVLNSACHNRDGQNVLFLDGHVEFEKHPNCSVQKDNIYQHWENVTDVTNANVKVRQFGDGEFRSSVPDEKLGTGDEMGPRHEQDAFLISEWNLRD